MICAKCGAIIWLDPSDNFFKAEGYPEFPIVDGIWKTSKTAEFYCTGLPKGIGTYIGHLPLYEQESI